jgi:hypothetical protein
MSFGYVNPEYCTIKNTVGAGIQLTMNLPLDTKSIVLSEPALLVIVIYGVGIGGVVLGRGGEQAGWGEKRREENRREWLGSRCSSSAGVPKLDARRFSKLCLDWRKRY